MKIALHTRSLQSGETAQQVFASEQDAIEWLTQRPRFTEVLGVAGPIPPEVNDRLKAAMRPLDHEETQLEQQLEAAIEDAARERAEARRKKEAEEAAARKKEMAEADPNRPMELRWTYDSGLSKVVADDPREITEEARQAVMAWVDERQEWVKSRGQVVGDARLTVYPGPLPDGVSERVTMGTFVPVTAPKEDA